MKPIIFFVFLTSILRAEVQGIDAKRLFTLDSNISVMPRKIIKSFQKAHHYLDSVGENDQEKAWLFYGFIATHFKYDFDRMHASSSKLKEYSPEYTCYKQSGVCRDFSKLYEALCTKSGVPCLLVIGKSKIPVFNFRERIKFFKQFSNHQWNVVRLNGNWYLVDPTWASIEKTDKLIQYDSKNQRKTVLVHRPLANYFCSDPSYFIRKHLPMHPAFFCNDSVPEFKRRFTKNPHKSMYSANYNYNLLLNSIWENDNPYLSKELYHVGNHYSGNGGKMMVNNYLWNEIDELIGPKINTQSFKLIDFLNVMRDWVDIENAAKENLNIDYFAQMQELRNTEIERLRRRLENMDKKDPNVVKIKKSINNKRLRARFL